MSVAIEARGCCSTSRSVRAANHKATAEPRERPVPCGQTPPWASAARGTSPRLGLCHQATARGSVFSLARERSRGSAITLLGCPPQGFLSAWSRNRDVFPLL